MDARVLDTVLVVAPLAAWFGAFGLAMAATRPETPAAALATEDLGPEPPAIVSMLVNHWDITEDAAESTLIDLAARHFLEFRQPGNDPMQTTIHVKQTDPAGLRAYEKLVFDRVTGLAVGGVIPLTALTFRDAGQATAWAKRLTAEVVAEARERGLSRRRFGPPIVTGLVVAAAIAALLLGSGIAAWLHRSHSHDTVQSALFAAGLTFAVLAGYAARSRGERDTAAGRVAASRWLGVRAWLRGHEAFSDLPPAAVTVWDRYLSYGAAVGATRVSSAVIDLGMGNRRNVWSSFGGTWHRVRVHYPRLRPHYGKTAPRLVLRGLINGVVGIVLIRFWSRGIGNAFSIGDPSSTRTYAYVTLVQWVGVLLGVAVAAFGAYGLIRTIGDLVTPVTLTGEVVWRQVWRTSTRNSDSSPVPWLHYLAVDDGSADSTRAWGLPAELPGRCDAGDTITMTARRWSRRVMSISATQHGGSQRLAISDWSSPDGDQTVAAAMGIARPRASLGLTGNLAPLASAGPLLTAEEVGAALGFPVTVRRAGQQVGRAPIEATEFRGPDGSTALSVMRSGGIVARIAIRSRRHGQEISGVGDEARSGPGWIVARRGDDAVIMHLAGSAVRGTPPSALITLARSAIGRLPAPPSAAPTTPVG